MNKIENFFIKKDLDKEEQVFHVIHKHWIEFIWPTLKWSILWILIPFFLVWLYPEYFEYIFIWFAFVAIMAIYDFFDWYMDVLILTDMWIIHSEWNWFFESKSSRMEYESIEDISFEHIWFFSSVFEYWDLHIERPSWEICFEHAADPKKAELKILDAKRLSKWSYWDIDMDWLKWLLSELVAEHMENNPYETWVVKKWFRRK